MSAMYVALGLVSSECPRAHLAAVHSPLTTNPIQQKDEDTFNRLFPGINLRTLAATFCFYIPGFVSPLLLSGSRRAFLTRSSSSRRRPPQSLCEECLCRSCQLTSHWVLDRYREVLLGGGVVDAARYSATRILDAGFSLALVPGGATEALHNHPDHDVVYIKKRCASSPLPLLCVVTAVTLESRSRICLFGRGCSDLLTTGCVELRMGCRRGFVKLGLEAGASLVPCFSFNECNTYGVLGVTNPTINKFRTKFQHIFGISVPLVTNILPMKTK